MPYRFLLDRDVEAIGDAFPDKLLINARFNLGPAEGETDRGATFVRKQLDLMTSSAKAAEGADSQDV